MPTGPLWRGFIVYTTMKDLLHPAQLITDMRTNQRGTKDLDSKSGHLLPIKTNRDGSTNGFILPALHIAYCARRNDHAFALNSTNVKTSAHTSIEHYSQCALLKLRQIKATYSLELGLCECHRPPKRSKAVQGAAIGGGLKQTPGGGTFYVG